MDLQFTPQEKALRNEIRAFLQERLPARISEKVKAGQRLAREDHHEWHSLLNSQGWLGYHWPKEYGGPGWGAVEKYIFDNECSLAGGPRIAPFGVSMLGPVLMKYGTEQQKSYWLPRILSGEDWWCQGYSEPGAGSDLASIRTTAVCEGDYYVVNGQKIWTTMGHYANMIFCLVRTDRTAKAQRGISFLLIDMKAPGVELRPIRMLDGDHEVNEVFFTDVKVPMQNMVGEENKGWTYAKYLLTYERTGIAGVGQAAAALEKLQALAARVTKNGRPLAEDPLFAARLACIEIDLENMKTTNLRVTTAASAGVPNAESSMLKIRGTEIRQEIFSLIRRAVGVYAAPFIEEAQYGDSRESLIGPEEAATAAASYFNHRKLSIFGGSNEIQKNIISKSILGL